MQRVTGTTPKASATAASIEPVAVSFEPARALGDVWALTTSWTELGFDRRLSIVRRSSRRQIPVEQLLRVMVFNRLSDPEFKLGVLRWLDTAGLPGIDGATIQHQHPLRAMDALIEEQERVDAHLATLLRPLIDTELSAVFYDLTSIRAERLSEQPGEIRRYGRSKDDGVRRQFVLGVVQSADGLPIHHESSTATSPKSPRSRTRWNASWRASPSDA